MGNCKNMELCGFVSAFAADGKNLLVNRYVSLYCKGEKQHICERKQYTQNTGKNPPDNLLPGGGFFARY